MRNIMWGGIDDITQKLKKGSLGKLRMDSGTDPLGKEKRQAGNEKKEGWRPYYFKSSLGAERH